MVMSSFVFQFELLAMLNLLQLVFLGIQLDGVVEWSWAVSEQAGGIGPT